MNWKCKGDQKKYIYVGFVLFLTADLFFSPHNEQKTEVAQYFHIKTSYLVDN